MSTAFVGYDLGDGETIIAFKLEDTETDPVLLQMPGKKDGFPIPTVVAKRKNGKPLIGASVFEYDQEELDEIRINFKKRPSTLITRGMAEKLLGEAQWDKAYSTPELDRMKESVVLFTNTLFLDKTIRETITNQIDEIALFVGHPTKWDWLDVKLYEKMLRESVLDKDKEQILCGKQIDLRLSLEMESRAAFLQSLYVKSSLKTQMTSNEAFGDNYIVIFDFGSSTTDVTAISDLKVDTELREGDPNLGARLIDKQIFNYILNTMVSTAEKEEVIQCLKDNTYKGEEFCIYDSRMGKEKYFSQRDADARQNMSIWMIPNLRKKKADDIYRVKLNHTHFDEILRKRYDELGGKTWPDACLDLFKRTLETMKQKGKAPKIAILTGGASRMDFVYEMCEKIFVPEGCKVLQDPNTNACVAQGLAVIGKVDKKSREFSSKVESFCTSKLPELISREIPAFSSTISGDLADYLLDSIIWPEAERWKSCRYSTLNAMSSGATEKARTALQGEAGKKILEVGIKEWIAKTILPQMDKELSNICEQYRVPGFQLEKLMVGALQPELNTDIKIDSSGVGASIISNINNVILAILSIVSVILLPTVIGLVSSIVLSITYLIVLLLFTVFGLNPATWPVIAALIGVGLVWITVKGWNAVKEKFSETASAFNFPQWMRNLVSDSKLKSEIKSSRHSVKSKIDSAITSNTELKSKLGQKVAEALKPLVDEKAQQLKLNIR